MHFDGPMVAGGNDYDLNELLSAQPPATLPTGLPPLDEFTRGIEQGAMWTLSGVAGIGVSSLALTIAANAASTGQVIVCNGHLPTRAAARQLAHLAGDGLQPRLSSWYSLLPEPPDPFSDSCLERCGLLVVDTWDETWHAAPWPHSRADLTRRLRWLRQLGRDHNTAILLTARTPAAPGNDVLGWMSDAFADAADVTITITDTPDVSRHASVRARGAGGTRFRCTAGSRVRLTPEQ